MAYILQWNDDIITTFQELDELNFDPLLNLSLFEKLTNFAYFKDSNILSIPQFSWHLFRTKHFERENFSAMNFSIICHNMPMDNNMP